MMCMKLKQLTMISSHSSSIVKSASASSTFPPSLHSLAPLSSSSCLPLQPKSRNFISLKPSAPFHGNSSVPLQKRNLSVVSASKSDDRDPSSSFQGGESFFRTVLQSMEAVYLNRNPTAKAVLELVQSSGNNQICYDHIAFRTFGLKRLALLEGLVDVYLLSICDVTFSFHYPDGGSGVNGPLPRVFISELLVDQMSPQIQEIIRKYTETSGSGKKHAALASALGSLTWGKPLYSEFQQLARESEYAAWTLVNGYAVNHVTISIHHLKSQLNNIKSLNQFIEDNGFRLNSEGGVLKVSPDGLLLQSSTVADSFPFCFSDGVTESVPCSYIEFAERLVLPQYKNLPEAEVKEFHRRDGFEVGNADKIFESTSKEQLTRRAA
ncbi:uncharacterized protein LOC102612790 isoform X2 [Citrus sinensis]|uniref:uncharacterized protein LOC102612790 isoform X2 n=1 Tax=Citrus sinensis TaxID=2711 RepID=UPI000D6299A5|nr:uncharacterized protein LOC102612790 isoform X2 [Citrus sinensis]